MYHNLPEPKELLAQLKVISLTQLYNYANYFQSLLERKAIALGKSCKSIAHNREELEQASIEKNYHQFTKAIINLSHLLKKAGFVSHSHEILELAVHSPLAGQPYRNNFFSHKLCQQKLGHELKKAEAEEDMRHRHYSRF